MNSDLVILYEKMFLIRLFEETLLNLFSLGHLRGTVHTCIGQEACAVGVVSAIDPKRDTLCSNHRGHGHFLAFTDDTDGLLKEILGLASGICGGKGGSQHLHVNNFYSNGILGGMVPIATGIALSQKFAAKDGISVVFVGDGAMSEGVIYEALNIASLWQLPLLLVIEHNQIAQSTPWNLEHGSAIEGRPISFGIPTETVDGNDVQAVYASTKTIVDNMRQDSKPRCLLLNTYRLGPHSKGDDYRCITEISFHQTNDPLKRAETVLSENVKTRIQTLCQTRINHMLENFSLL
ncbi:thiamine pyrophosphate-dependent dehydrogenase E1 component subunit alpha [Chromatium okenii]|jgi:TPP-dependent pyruvate/acetoin dehydrogenase alpha subunit|uniref:Pyruvate dehydrogenase n=2 Tax=Chromatium okenii TaxID=61644 RepID=A0A2S7XUP1_9GAMM|nr:thiamine pyrophosphate-dependent dehydrogenase E1 component subunit alpha [Chromatium okenii]MBV5311608.1 thiamine pyrophosphate-dependent dehydrogenase E1 component subunit alpha [Chromatium okenii]PQJ95485.1 pyruvate dehydrogenase [Chromatium okenii]PQJ97459.1 pyruvate dehydrogenase [Chromatium okenii]